MPTSKYQLAKKIWYWIRFTSAGRLSGRQSYCLKPVFLNPESVFIWLRRRPGWVYEHSCFGNYY